MEDAGRLRFTCTWERRERDRQGCDGTQGVGAGVTGRGGTERKCGVGKPE